MRYYVPSTTRKETEMTLEELNEDQLRQLKQDYINKLAEQGQMNEVLYDRPEDDDDPEKAYPSYNELSCADTLVSMDMLKREYEGTCFTEEDFK